MITLGISSNEVELVNIFISTSINIDFIMHIQFTETRQWDFKQMIANAVTKYCQENSNECQGVSIKQR